MNAIRVIWAGLDDKGRTISVIGVMLIAIAATASVIDLAPWIEALEAFGQ